MTIHFFHISFLKLITNHNSTCWKVMFSQAPVCSRGGGAGGGGRGNGDGEGISDARSEKGKVSGGIPYALDTLQPDIPYFPVILPPYLTLQIPYPWITYIPGYPISWLTYPYKLPLYPTQDMLTLHTLPFWIS